MSDEHACTSCGRASRPGSRFCDGCGAALAVRCAACGTELRPDAHFCDACGTPVQPAAGGEARKTVSVVFADLVGSTALQESLDAESVRRVMARFYAAMQGVIESHGGRVEKFIGDAVMGVFGVPLVREDDAVRACRAALAMQTALEALNGELDRDWGVCLAMRTGVNTGEVVVGAQGFLVGDPVNVAARLEQAAGPGQILVGEATARLARGAVGLEPIAPLAAKGKSAVVGAYALSAATGVARMESHFVGRAAELAVLRAVFDEAREQRACRLATIIGSPGLGKTRLAAQLADAVAGDAVVVEGRCEPQGAGITFLPIADVLRDAAGIGEADPPDVVQARLQSLVAGDPDAQRIVQHAAAVLGLGAPASAEETFWAVRRMLEHLARRRPLLVLLDDIHWGQPQFLDLIEHLVQWVVDAPICVLALARPELRDHHDALTRHGAVPSAVVDLEPLGDGHSRRLMSSLVAGAALPEALVARILDTTGGNPLFLGETIRMLVDDGVLRRGEDGSLEAYADSVDVPPTIAALLEARIERLGADERSVVERAAVIGKQFYRGAVAELAPAPVAMRVDVHLEALRRKEMVEPDGTYWIDEPVYRFHHVLIRDAAYRALLKEARSELHERFAHWLEEKAGELVGEHEEVIAFHLEQAHEYRRELGPLDARGRALGAEASARLGSAGRRALARDDLAAAANLLERALSRLASSEGTQRAEILIDLGETLLSAGDTAAAEELVAQLRLLAGTDVRLAARADVLDGELATLTGEADIVATVATARAGAAALRDAGDRAGEAKAHHVVAQALALLGQVAAVEESLDHALAAARAADDRRRVTAILAAAPRAALWGPSPVVRASGRCLDVVRILRMTPGNRHVEAVALRCQAVLEAMRGRTQAARDILAAGRATLEELGLALELHETAMHAGIVELLAGDPVAAEGALRSAVDGFTALGVDRRAAQASALLARALVDQGRHDEAVAATEDAERRGGGDLKTAITWCGVRAEALARGGQVDEALALARRAVDLAEPTDALPDKADAWMALATVHVLAGQEAEARTAAARAREHYAAKDHGVGVLRATAVAGGSNEAHPARAHPGPGAIADPALRAFFTQYAQRYAARDAAGVVAMYDPSYVLVDHRRLGWGEIHGLEGAERQVRTAMGASEDLRFGIDEVFDARDGAIAMRIVWHGSSTETGGVLSLALGYAAEVRDGRLVRIDLYEPDDVAGVRRRFAELRGPADAAPAPVRVLEAMSRAWATMDADAVLALSRPGAVMHDRRTLGYTGLIEGTKAFEDLVRSMVAGANELRFDIDEVLRSDDRVAAARCTFRGRGHRAGPFELPVGLVVIAEGDQWSTIDYFDRDDREALIARFDELTRTPAATPLEALLARHNALIESGDVDALLAIAHPGATIVDHRSLNLASMDGDTSHDAWAAIFSMWETLRFDVDEILASDDHVIAFRGTFRGIMRESGGDAEDTIGAVWLVEDERIRSVDIYPAADVSALVARFAELGGGLSALRGHPLESFWRALAVPYAAVDIDASMDLIADDFVQVDHRVLAWEPMDRDALRDLITSAHSVTPGLHMVVDEVLAGDDRVIAAAFTFRGLHGDSGGPADVSFGVVAVIEDGLYRRAEYFDHDGHAAMLQRYAALGGTGAPGWLVAQSTRAFNAHDIDGMLSLFSPDVVYADRRNLALGDTVGTAAIADVLRGLFDVSGDLRREVDTVVAADDEVIAALVTYRGTGDEQGIGLSERANGEILVVRDGRYVRMEHYEPDREVLLARFAELTGRPREPERVWAQAARCLAARDLDGMMSVYADDFVSTDHRPLGWGRRGLAASRAFWASVLDSSPDIRFAFEEVLACDDRVIAHRVTACGTNRDGGGPFELAYGIVSLVEGGLVRRTDLFEPDDHAAMMARYAELTSAAPPPALARHTESTGAGTPRPPERVLARIQSCVATRDVDGLMALRAPDAQVVDHRNLGPLSMDGLQAARSTWEAVFAMWPQLRVEIDEVLACDDHVVAYRSTYYGVAAEGSGAATTPAGHVIRVEEDVIVRVDIYEHEDVAALFARYAELGGTRLPEALLARMCGVIAARDAEGMLALWSPAVGPDDLVDHRAIGHESPSDHAELARYFRSIVDAPSEVEVLIDEVLAGDDHLVAARLRFVGRGADAGPAQVAFGDFEIPIGAVWRVQDGRFSGCEMFEPDDRDAVLARFTELGGRVERRRSTASDDAFNRRDLGAMAATYAEDIVLIDHRALGWERFEGRAAVLEQAESLWRHMAQDIQVVSQDVLAADGRVFARVASYRGSATEGGGELELALGQVGLMSGHVIEQLEWFDPGDKSAMLARYAELTGERIYQRFDRLYTAGLIDALAELYTEDLVIVDRRQMAWDEQHGRQAMIDTCRGLMELAPDRIGRSTPLADDGGPVILVRFATTGTASALAAGDFEIGFDLVMVLRGELGERIEMFERDDPAARARHAELRAEHERPYARFDRLFNARDLAGLRALYSEYVVLVDHRPAGWDAVHGPDALVELFTTTIELAPDQRSRCEPLADDGGDLALFRITVAGSGAESEFAAFEIVIDMLLVERGGQIARLEAWAPGDPAARARYDELRAPPCLRFDRLFDARRLDELPALFTEDFVMVDRRQMAWEETHGPDGLMGLLRSTAAVASDHVSRCEALVPDDDGPVAYFRNTLGRRAQPPFGDFETVFDHVMVIAADGRMARTELFDPAQAAESSARYEQLRQRPHRRFDQLFNERRVAELETLYAEDLVLVDRRSVAVQDHAHGPEAMAEVARSGLAVSDAARSACVLLAPDHGGDVLYVRDTFSSSSGTPPFADFELVVDLVYVVRSDGLITHIEMFDQSQEAESRARYDELR